MGVAAAKVLQGCAEPRLVLPSAPWSDLSVRPHDCAVTACGCDLFLDRKLDCSFSIPHLPHWAGVSDLLSCLSHLPGVIHPYDFSRVSAFQDVCPPLRTGESFPFCPTRCMSWHLFIYSSWVLLKGFVQVIKPESAVWMSVPWSPSFTTPPALSPYELHQLWICSSQSPLKGHACPHLPRLCVWHTDNFW